MTNTYEDLFNEEYNEKNEHSHNHNRGYNEASESKDSSFNEIITAVGAVVVTAGVLLYNTYTGNNICAGQVGGHCCCGDHCHS
ncbi:MAG: hypothetical protein AABY27_07205 [Pseudomonadota bacterium]